MKAVVFHEFGGPQVLRLEEVATPVPGPGEVLIDVRAVSVNRTLDLAVRAGRYAHRPPLPHVLGVDPCGVVTAVGEGVRTRKVGDRLATGPIVGTQTDGAPIILGVNTWGGYAQYVKIPAQVTHFIPPELDFMTAAVVARHAPLALTQLRDRGLGSIAVQAAKHLGAHVIAAAGTDARVDAARQLGADAGVNYHAQDLTAEVRRITGGAGVNVVLENEGDPELFPKAFAVLTRSGRLVTAGGHAGGIVPLDVKHLYLNRITVIGDPLDTPENFELGLKLAAQGQLKVLIDHVLPLSAAAHAHEMVEARDGIGKVLLDPTRMA